LSGSSLFLFAYGTLQIPVVMQAVTGQKLSPVDAVLRDYCRYSIKDEVYPAIIAQTGATVSGQLYTGLDRSTLKILDAFEDVIYARCEKEVVTTDNVFINAQVYVISAEHRHRLTDMPWDLEEFRRYHLEKYMNACDRFLARYNRRYKTMYSDQK
jgi:gamma-glutamylcyclotransferase (GGCT)/AIG2-like uncharacterized protein YtfP